jgi:chromosome partitioning protein
MAEMICVAQSKGGSAKSTTAVNLAAAYARDKQRVLILDLDAQSTTSDWLGFHDAENQSDLLECMLGDMELQSAIRSTSVENLDLVPASQHLYQIHNHLADEVAADTLLSFALRDVLTSYDKIIVDCPPSLGIAAYNAMYACKNIILPIETSFVAMRAVRSMMKVVNLMQERRDESINILGIIASRADMRQKSCQQAIDMMRESFNGTVFDTVITDAVALKDAPAHEQTIFQYQPNSKSAKQFQKLATEIQSRLGKGRMKNAA